MSNTTDVGVEKIPPTLSSFNALQIEGIPFYHPFRDECFIGITPAGFLPFTVCHCRGQMGAAFPSVSVLLVENVVEHARHELRLGAMPTTGKLPHVSKHRRLFFEKRGDPHLTIGGDGAFRLP